MARPFLTARWLNLFNATYAVPPSLLEPRLPPGLTLEVQAGRAFVSLVAFDFTDTRVLGIAWPGYREFAELNLRFYVRYLGEPGVVFIREFVPRRLIAWMAWLIYNEPYHAAPVRSQRSDSADALRMEYQLDFAGRTHTIRVTADRQSHTPPTDSTEHFFKEHHWGFGTTRSGRALRYQVDHPVWEIHTVREHQLDFDFGSVYGPEWAFLSAATPINVLLAKGSDVCVWPKGGLL